MDLVTLRFIFLLSIFVIYVGLIIPPQLWIMLHYPGDASTQSEIFLASMKIRFSFHVTFSHLTEDNITYSRSNSGSFSKYCSTIYVGESLSIFLCFMLFARQCSAIYQYKKRVLSSTLECTSYRHLPSYSLVPQAVRINILHRVLPAA